MCSPQQASAPHFLSGAFVHLQNASEAGNAPIYLEPKAIQVPHSTADVYEGMYPKSPHLDVG